MAVIRFITSAVVLGAAMMVTGCSTGSSQVANWNHFGTSRLGNDRPVALSVVDESKAGPVVVEGTITEVCQTKGCWMNIVDGGRTARVKFKDYAFFVPRNAAGRRVVVKGWGEKTLMDVEWARHIAEDAGKSRAEIDAITKPVEIYEIEATAVYIEGDGLDAPHTGG